MNSSWAPAVFSMKSLALMMPFTSWSTRESDPLAPLALRDALHRPRGYCPGSLTDDHHRTRGVVQYRVAHRPQENAAEPSQTPRPDHEELRILGGGEDDVRGSS